MQLYCKLSNTQDYDQLRWSYECVIMDNVFSQLTQENIKCNIFDWIIFYLNYNIDSTLLHPVVLNIL